MSSARLTLPEGLARLLRFQLEIAVDQANLGDADRRIAELHFLERVPQVEIGAALNYDRSSVSRRIPKITEAVIQSAERIFP